MVSLGGETQLVYKLGKQGGIVSVHSGNKCASGTGEFFLQQIRRMGLSLDAAVSLAHKGRPHKIAGRCSVFCKSDCTHALNKGELVENVAAGLCAMVADKITDLIKDLPCESVMLVGGGSLNSAVVDILSSRFAHVHVPDTAACYEAYGAAVWAFANECRAVPSKGGAFVHGSVKSFGSHPPLSKSQELVDFKQALRVPFDASAEYLFGLDVGSTTTKAVLLNRRNLGIAASVYLRTNGNPVEASRQCYAAIMRDMGDGCAEIAGLGVTGSGRQIAGLHALTENVINEIVAHAAAAAHFDKDVDTIFEIGGQDAKYTYLTGGVPSDYAMNEACSAGTGSFLEESALESLSVKMEDIGGLALAGAAPPNFTDQCAAFISSDIKLAGQQGTDRNNILAGLVYSICLNYLNRVKGFRPVGKKIFMQGGVCYNTAVPVAMASLLQARIIVPPDPGLMGALGVALEVDKRLRLGLCKPARFDLAELANRAAKREGSFVCAGGKEKCDRKCEISRIRVAGAVHPFGGTCNRYYNIRLKTDVDAQELDLVAVRERLLYQTYGVPPVTDPGERRSVGLCRSFLTHSLYPLYSHFFAGLGYAVVLSDDIDAGGISRIESAYCLPAEIAHGSFLNLLKKNLDYIFVPHVMQVPVKNVPTYSRLCVFVQGEPYYLKTTFRREIDNSPTVVLSPVLCMDKDYGQAARPLYAMASKMGIAEPAARAAFEHACAMQRAFEAKLRQVGAEALSKLDSHPEMFGIVLFGRPYNAFSADANMGIPHKTASRGYLIIPHDMLPADKYEVDRQMFWAMGQKIMKAAHFVRGHGRLFGFYVTNFSCGPDSFLLTYFRNLMGRKPSLTLELDQHTADAGIDTRIEAALDIMKSWALANRAARPHRTHTEAPVVAFEGGETVVRMHDGRKLSIFDPGVEVVLPSMGRFATEGVAAVLRGIGVDAKGLAISDKDVLLEGRKNTSCKECLPYIVTVGSFVKYLRERASPDKVTLFLMASGGGPCRLGQYCTAMEQLFANLKIGNAAMLPMTNENGYAGLGSRALLSASQAITISDVFCHIRSFLSVAAVHKAAALETFEGCWRDVIAFFERKKGRRLSLVLASVSRTLAGIPLSRSPREVPVVSLVGEIFVRHDEFSRKNIASYLEDRGIAVRIAPILEYFAYSNYVINKGLGEKEQSIGDQMKLRVIAGVQEWWERRIKSALAKSGCYGFDMIQVEKTMESAAHVLNENFRGECVLTVGLGLREILHDSCGVISIGPFGCMPSRVAEAILKKEMNEQGMLRMNASLRDRKLLKEIPELPFLAIETDGSPFPQLVEANLEAFVVQAKRVHEAMGKHSKASGVKGRVLDVAR